MDIDMSFRENLNNKIIFISNDHNKYYSNVPDDAIIQYGKDNDVFWRKKASLKYQKK